MDLLDGVKQEGLMQDEELEKLLYGNDEDLEQKTDEQDKGEKDTPSDSQPENKPEEDTPSHQGGEEGKGEEDKTEEPSDNTDDVKQKKDTSSRLDKEPRFKEVVQMKNNLLEENKTLKERLESLESQMQKFSEQTDDEQIPPWFIETYGDDKDLWKKMKSGFVDKIKADIKAEIINESRQEKEQAEADIKHWDQWVEDQILILKEEGHDFDENKLKKLVVKTPLIDKDGNLDFRKVLLEHYPVWYPKKSTVNKEVEAQKEVADMTMEDSKGSTEKDEGVQSQKSLRAKSFQDLARMS